MIRLKNQRFFINEFIRFANIAPAAQSLEGMVNKMNDMGHQNYEDIIHLPHPVSVTHPPMTMHDRAAQFSPFAALTGYHDIIEEETRINTGEEG